MSYMWVYLQGYSYVGPSVLFGDNVVSNDIFKGVRASNEESQRTSVSNMFAARFEESSFFQLYEMNTQEEALGDGSFSVCRRCRHRQSQQEYAVKIISQRVDCSREVNLLRTCQGHPNVVKLIEVYQDRAHTYLVMELLSGGELLGKPRPFTEEQASRVMRQLACAMQYVHSRGVVHRDLKPENIVFVHQGEDSPVKIVDFGFARIQRTYESLHTPCFTLPYAAPEVLARQGYSQSCDMWSLGTVLYFMLSSSPPFGTSSPDLATLIRAGEINFDSSTWDHLTDQTKQVLKGLLTIDPKDRFTANTLVNHPWLAEPSAPLPALPDAISLDATNNSACERAAENFRLREVDGAKLAQRRKLHKRSNSSSVSSSASTTSSSQSTQRPQSASVSNATATSASPAQPNVFDFGEDKVNEYLSSLSSSSDSNSPRISYQQEANERKRKPEADSCREKNLKLKRYKCDNEFRKDGNTENNGGSGPLTRSQKRKLEQALINSDSSAESSESVEGETQGETNIHRKQKVNKRSKRLVIDIVN